MKPALAFAVLVLCGAMGAVPAFAEDPTAKDIVDALAPKASLLRSLDAAQAEKKQADLVGRLQGAATRQITVEERNEIADVVATNGLPAIDLEIFFKFDSARVTPEAMPALKALGAALGDEKLAGSIFLIAGHTDANGSDAYNLALSDARAKSVRAFLIDQFQVDPKRLVAVGFGEEQLKNRANPAAGENGRVQVVNIATAPVAGR